jgi:DNA mismatch endonuclease (patch repair protein)
MTDHLTEERRSWNMSRIKGNNTKPEVQLRSLLHRAGYRFTVNAPNNKKLPGRPDIVLPRYKTIIFVHGCFWHRHPGCNQATTPKTRTQFWQNKFAKNVVRDKRNIEELKSLGWNVIVVWECELKRFPPPPRLRRDMERGLKGLILLRQGYGGQESLKQLLARGKATPLLAAEEQSEYSTQRRG